MLKQNLTKHLFFLALIFFNSIAYAQQAPTFKLPGDGSKMYDLSQFRGKVVYIDFWASWCKPCRKSFPWLNEIYSRYKNENLQIIAINLDTSRDDAQQFLEKVPAKFDVAYDPDGSVANKYKLQVMPSSYLIDKKGNLKMAHKGFREGDSNAMEKAIQKLLEAR
jgi:thiol-disulfide isomerase/thioredoxin